MRRIPIPGRLSILLSNNELGDAFDQLNRAASPILRDNKLPFFPDYTDHGAAHVQSVLEDQLKLLAANAWETETLSCGDAFLIAASTVLHDLAMHLSPDGFFDLISSDRRQPFGLRFGTNSSSFGEDQSWLQEWRRYIAEARDWGPKKQMDVFGRIYSPTSKRWRKWLEVDTKAPKVDRRFAIPLVGEFLRRHHARLAYEISVFGFPGAGRQFPVLHQLVPGTIGELAGFVARSHHFSIRSSAKFLFDRLERHVGPFESHPVLAMVLLRVSDYLQIAADRAPDVLLRLRNPSSPLSVREWKKHSILNPVSFALADQETLFFEARSTKPDHPVLVAVQSLLSDLQRELDQSNSVLREVYPKWGPAASLRLGFSRIRSDLDTDAFLTALPYVPKPTSVSIDRSVVSLLAGPLYGNRPEFAIRELIQNAVDAVIESRHLYPSDPIEIRRYPDVGDVEVLFKRRKRGWRITVTDSGIGMRRQTVVQHLLRVGVSFRSSSEWKGSFSNSEGRVEIARSGRFGVGIFSAFLLGPQVKVFTRHIAEPVGFRICLEPEAETVELRKKENIPHGTRVEIDLSDDAVQKLGLDNPDDPLFAKGWDWWTWDSPTVTRRIQDGSGVSRDLPTEFSVPRQSVIDECGWRSIDDPTFRHVFWSVIRKEVPSLCCNGLRVAKLSANVETRLASLSNSPVQFEANSPKDPSGFVPFEMPFISVVDHNAALNLKASREELESPGDIPFSKKLKKDVALDFVAFCLVAAPTRSLSEDESQFARKYPLLQVKHPMIKLGLDARYAGDSGTVDIKDVKSDSLTWTVLSDTCYPNIPWLLQQQEFDEVVWFGPAASRFSTSDPFPSIFGVPSASSSTLICYVRDNTLENWFGQNRFADLPLFTRILRELTESGVPGVGTGSEIYAAAFGKVTKIRTSCTVHGNLAQFAVVADSASTLRLRFPSTGTTTSPPEQIAGIVERHDSLPEELAQSLSHYAVWSRVNRPTEPSDPVGYVEKQWSKHLGTRGVPIDPTRRQSLVSEVCETSPRLKMYIEKWQAYLATFLVEPF